MREYSSRRWPVGHGGRQFLRHIGKADQAARDDHCAGLEFLARVELEVEPAVALVELGDLDGLDIGDTSLLEPLAVADEQVDGYLLVLAEPRDAGDVAEVVEGKARLGG